MIVMLEDIESPLSVLDLAHSKGANYAENARRRQRYITWITQIDRRLSDVHVPCTFNENSAARHNGKIF